MSKDNQSQPPKPRYQITNWAPYNKARQQRGRISLWLPANSTQLWYEQPTTKPIGANTYSSVAIEFWLTIRQLYHLPYRQSQGFVEDLFEWLDLDLRVPSYAQMQRRARQLQIDLKPTEFDSPVSIVIDSTGLKVKGDGAARAVEGAPAR